jgi:hypothetical protein
MLVMPSVDDVVEAFNGIEKAWEHYRDTLRACLAEGTAEGISGRQAEIARRLKRTREMLRRDAMTEEQREALRMTEAERKRVAKKAAAPAKRTRKTAK